MTIEQQAELTLTDDVWETDEAVPDPHYLELLRSSKLPQSYLPSMMGGVKKPWIRISSLVIIGVFFFATFCGICLTYGPNR